MEDIYVEVALPIAQYKTFTYKIPNSLYNTLENKELIGRRVLVPFRNTGFSGIIISTTTKPTYQVKNVEQIPDKDVIFTRKELSIIHRLSDYYIAPIGMTANFFLPDVLNWKKKNGKWIKSVKEEKIYVPAVVSTTGIERLSPKSLELLEFILERGETTKDEIVEFGFSLSSLKTLLKKGLIKEEKFFFRETTLKNKKEKYISEEKFLTGNFLYSFNKAELRLKKYIPLINSNIKNNKDVIIIFPTVKTVENVYSFLKSYFGDKIFVYHDGISGKKKLETWFNFRKYSGTVLVSTFSGFLIPTKELGLIILEDEHSETYKALRVPRFDTRRVAVEVSKEKNSSLIFGSTSSSVESYYLLKKGFFKNLEKWKTPQTTLEIEPLNKEKIFTQKITDLIRRFETVLIISNKKAYASFLYCKKCEEEILCPDCEIPLKVYSKPDKYLKCELCKNIYKYITHCPICDTRLIEIGFGIEKIEELLNKYFKNQISYLEDQRDTKIKLATNIIDKEHLIKDFSLVINIYPDFLLNINDFRGSEKFFRNIFTAFFKAKNKYVLITNNIENPAVKSLKQRKPQIFYEEELKNRKEFELPPYAKFILLTFEKKNLEKSTVNQIFTQWIKEQKILNIDYRGVFPAYYHHIRGKVRYQIILKNFKEKQKLKKLYEKCSKKGIKLIIDVDPKQII